MEYGVRDIYRLINLTFILPILIKEMVSFAYAQG